MDKPNDKMMRGFVDVLNYRMDALMSRYKDKLGSPIEEIFLRAFELYSIAHSHQSIVLDAKSPLGREDLRSQGLGPHEILRPQYQIDGYRVDFHLESEASGRIVLSVIECDGHDFHERTKEQAGRDRKRDRDLQAAGFLVFRFTGSQIYRDPWGCVQEMYDAIHAVGEARDIEDDKRDHPEWRNDD